MAPLVGVNLVTDNAFAVALRPLVAEGLVEAIEWDIDSAWVARTTPELPVWIDGLLDLYSSQNRLYGHCVWLSLLSPEWQNRQTAWIENLAAACKRRRFRLVSEHLGFVSAGPYVINTLLPSPYVEAAVNVGRNRVARLREATGTTVGLENLAGALAPSDATTQAAFLRDILGPGDGFLLLDVHNVFAQAVNLDLDPLELLVSFPLDRVRIIHISGGRWLDVDGRPFRFDGHNGSVPPEVFALLRSALALCPAAEVVFFERRPNSLQDPAETVQLQNDYRRVVEIVRTSDAHGKSGMARTTPVPCQTVIPRDAITDAGRLSAYQAALVEVLMAGGSAEELRASLLAHPAIQPVRDYVKSFAPRCLSATSTLVRRWARTEAHLAVTGMAPNQA